jgi:hypothetical protein
MSPLRTIARDLVDRRLWPLAALLAVGLVAIPVVFLRPAPNAVSEAPAPAAAPVAPSNPAAAAATTSPLSDPVADPSVALTSSPFAAAFAGPLDLPPSMQGLLKATKGADDRRDVADAPLRDPFATGVPSVKTASTQPSGASAPRATTSVASGGGAAVAPSSPGSVPGPSSPSVPSTPSAPQDTPSTPSEPTPPAAGDWHVYRTDVSFGTTETLPVDADASRLTAYPSLVNPIAIYLGVMRGGWGAVFMLRDDVRPVGAPSCRPRKSICTWVILHPGESVTLNAKDATTGVVTPYTLKLAAIHDDTLSEDAAKAFYGKANSGGRCLLGPLAAYHFDPDTGTLALRPEMKACRYQGDDGTSTDAGTTSGDGTTAGDGTTDSGSTAG